MVKRVARNQGRGEVLQLCAKGEALDQEVKGKGALPKPTKEVSHNLEAEQEAGHEVFQIQGSEEVQ